MYLCMCAYLTRPVTVGAHGKECPRCARDGDELGERGLLCVYDRNVLLLPLRVLDAAEAARCGCPGSGAASSSGLMAEQTRRYAMHMSPVAHSRPALWVADHSGVNR